MVRSTIVSGIKLVAIGLGVGMACAIATTRLMSSMLFEVPPPDGVALIGGALVLAAAAVACGLPARTAAHVDPRGVTIEVVKREYGGDGARCPMGRPEWRQVKGVLLACIFCRGRAHLGGRRGIRMGRWSETHEWQLNIPSRTAVCPVRKSLYQ